MTDQATGVLIQDTVVNGLVGVAAGDRGDRVTIDRPAALIRLVAGRVFLTEGARGDARGIHTLADQIIASGIGAACAESQVVLAGTALITMAFYGHGQ